MMSLQTSCLAQLGGRVAQGVIAALVAVLAAAIIPLDPVVGVAAGLGAVGIALLAVTGRCVTTPPDGPAENTVMSESALHLHFLDARAAVDINGLQKEEKTHEYRE